MNDNQLLWLSKNFNKKYARIENGIATMIGTGEEIPVEHMIYQTVKPDGVYELGEMTCGGALSLGHDEDTLEPIRIENPTQEDFDNYQCRIGRHAPKCMMYSKKKCAVYSFDNIDRFSLSFKASELIAICNIN